MGCRNRADVGAVIRAERRAEFRAEKNGSDAVEFAEEMQKEESRLYVFSTGLDAEKHGCGGLSRILHLTEAVCMIRYNPPDSWSILRLQKKWHRCRMPCR